MRRETNSRTIKTKRCEDLEGGDRKASTTKSCATNRRYTIYSEDQRKLLYLSVCIVFGMVVLWSIKLQKEFQLKSPTIPMYEIPTSQLVVAIGVFSTARPQDQLWRNLHRETHFLYNSSCSSTKQITRQPCSVLWRFVIGYPQNSEWMKDIIAENNTYGDIVLLNVNENMNKGKSYAWWVYASSNFNNALFFGKIDMDTYVWIPFLLQDLRKFSDLRSVYYGRYSCGHRVNCPPIQQFVSGGFQILSRDLAYWIADPLNNFVKNRISGYEDLNTGIWLHEGHRFVRMRSPCPSQIENMHKIYNNESCGKVFKHWVKRSEDFRSLWFESQKYGI